MDLVDVKSFLASNRLNYPVLAVLQANEALYSALLIQPKAVMAVSNTSIANADRDEAEALFMKAISLAVQEKVELLVTPEYSLPWVILEQALRITGGPAEGNLWVLGCESYPLALLPQLKVRFAPWAVLLHEDLPVSSTPSTATFVDPVVYLFRTTLAQSGNSQLVMLVQFKTYVSGDPSNTEAICMAPGKQIYHFDGGRNEVSLLTLICSDTFAFEDRHVDFCYNGLLLLHIQLNDRPRDSDYVRYRSRLFRTREDVSEVVALNWAGNIEFRMEGNPNPHARSSVGGSGCAPPGQISPPGHGPGQCPPALRYVWLFTRGTPRSPGRAA